MALAARKPRTIRSEQAARLAAYAIRRGAKIKAPHSYEWDVSGLCEKPKLVQLTGQTDIDRPTPIAPFKVFFDMWVRCRRCDACLKLRRSEWYRRVSVEVERAPRTWFATLTFEPNLRAKILATAQVDMARRGLDYEAEAEEERTAALNRAARNYVTLWLKRVRKNTNALIRYVIVLELHEDGFPHYHAMIHVIAGQVGERDLRYAWDNGFSRFKLIEKEHAGYIVKYLTKALGARIRASISYGNASYDIVKAAKKWLRANGQAIVRPNEQLET